MCMHVCIIRVFCYYQLKSVAHLSWRTFMYGKPVLLFYLSQQPNPVYHTVLSTSICFAIIQFFK